MNELSISEIEQVNGGIIPFLIGVDIGLNAVLLAVGYASGAFE